MTRYKYCLVVPLLVEMACGGNVATDSAGNSSGGNNASYGTGVGGANAGGLNSVGTAVATGGTDSNYPGGMVSVTQSEVNQLMNTACTGLEDSTGSCALTIPPLPSGEVIDENKVWVVYGVNGGTTDQELISQTYNNCPQGDGWYWSTGDSGMPQITLCAKTCATIHLDMNPTLSVYAECVTGCCIE